MAVNPAGFVQVTDGGAPRIFSAAARETISGGQAVFCSGVADAVSSGLNSFVTNDIKVATGASGLDFNGIAIATQTSGTNSLVGVLGRGHVIVRAAGTVASGRTIVCNGGDAYVTGTAAGTVVGRAITAATSGGYFVADIRA